MDVNLNCCNIYVTSTHQIPKEKDKRKVKKKDAFSLLNFKVKNVLPVTVSIGGPT